MILTGSRKRGRLMVNWSSFRINIRGCRSHRGFTQKDVALYVGVSDKAVVDWENGYSSPTAEKAQKMAELFDIPLEHIDFSKEGNKQLSKMDRQKYVARRLEPDTIG